MSKKITRFRLPPKNRIREDFFFFLSIPCVTIYFSDILTIISNVYNYTYLYYINYTGRFIAKSKSIDFLSFLRYECYDGPWY